MIETAVRCPKCGSTNAGKIGQVYENRHMKCHNCGHEAYADNYQVADDWNVTLPPGTTELPAFLPPLKEGD